uniref:Uncharacterized protein n=1 Tax=Cucumis melo TaxID=3656 RepID=A0A9I9DA13_CUCME
MAALLLGPGAGANGSSSATKALTDAAAKRAAQAAIFYISVAIFYFGIIFWVFLFLRHLIRWEEPNKGRPNHRKMPLLCYLSSGLFG